MEGVVLLVLVTVALVNADAPDQHNLTTLNEFFIERYNLPIQKFVFDNLRSGSELPRNTDDIYPWTLTVIEKVLNYTKDLEEKIISDFVTVLENVTVQSIYEDLNYTCYEQIDDLGSKISNTTCVTSRLEKMLFSHQRNKTRLQGNHSCQVYHEQLLHLLSEFINDMNDVKSMDETSPLEIIKDLVAAKTQHLYRILKSVYDVIKLNLILPIEPFEVQNVLQPSDFMRKNITIRSEDKLTWGIVSSNTATVDILSDKYIEKFSKNSTQFLNYTNLKLLESVTELMRCVTNDFPSIPLTWSTFPSIYFHSHCLCLLSDNNYCGDKAPEGVDSRFYCLALLLRDFQRQISYRPAATYLDYAFKIRVPVCKVFSLMKIAFRSDCNDTLVNNKRSLDLAVSVQCFFKDLVSKHLNCSERLIFNTDNQTLLCGAKYFLELVPCDGDESVDVPFYKPGDSTTQRILTYIDVSVRIITLITYLVCPQLRNFPGMLLIGYQVTALSRLLLVRAFLYDFTLVVYITVAMDLSSTLWLAAYLHFLTWCCNSVRYSVPQRPTLALRVLQSIRPDENRRVFIRYTLFGWALPAVLSALFFWMNEAIDSHLQFGQLLFVLCNYTALFANLYMFTRNCLFYYEVRNTVCLSEEGVRKRDIFASLFNFAMKTSVLTGAGIILRLVFTQIEGLEDLLGYFHALGKLQGFLLFALFGCSQEARDFWLRVVSSKFHQCRRRQDTSA